MANTIRKRQMHEEKKRVLGLLKTSHASLTGTLANRGSGKTVIKQGKANSVYLKTLIDPVVKPKKAITAKNVGVKKRKITSGKNRRRK